MRKLPDLSLKSLLPPIRKLCDALLVTRAARGIVFLASRDECEKLYAGILSDGFISCVFLHSALEEVTKKAMFEAIMADDEKPMLVLATTLLGAGFDHPNVCFTAHVRVVFGDENLAQEQGRGGRSGQPSLGLVLIDGMSLGQLEILKGNALHSDQAFALHPHLPAYKARSLSVLMKQVEAALDPSHGECIRAIASRHRDGEESHCLMLAKGTLLCPPCRFAVTSAGLASQYPTSLVPVDLIETQSTVTTSQPRFHDGGRDGGGGGGKRGFGRSLSGSYMDVHGMEASGGRGGGGGGGGAPIRSQHSSSGSYMHFQRREGGGGGGGEGGGGGAPLGSQHSSTPSVAPAGVHTPLPSMSLHQGVGGRYDMGGGGGGGGAPTLSSFSSPLSSLRLSTGTMSSQASARSSSGSSFPRPKVR